MSDESMNKFVGPNDRPIPWREVAEGLGLRSRKTVKKLVDQGFLARLPGVDRLLITASSYRAYVAGAHTERGH
jgi:hypothetical protein